MNMELKEVILQQCRKKVIPLESYDEEAEEAEGIEEQESEIIKEPPFEDILAEKRRKYSDKEEFIFLLYNDILKYFVKEWDGHYLRKKPRKIFDDDSKISSSEYEDEGIDEKQDYEDINELKGSNDNFEECNDDASKSRSNCFWKLMLPDEFANIKFITNNTYSGRISRKMMEGEGVYRWTNGAQYKGEFQQNLMHGKGLLEWNSVCWYEGDFVNGYRHGRGIMVDGENRYMYTGHWYMGQRHGKGKCMYKDRDIFAGGAFHPDLRYRLLTKVLWIIMYLLRSYSRYGDNGSYDGDWVMDKMNGVGLRIYPSGSRYVGQWKNGIRNGIGTMVWTNGNIYRGEWKCGAMHGYGEYVWNGFFNKTFTWPQEASYAGYWRHGMRHGKGEIKLNSVGGAKYSGYWKDNKKHGYGVIIGSNGEKFEANPLFLNDILCTTDVTNSAAMNETETKNEQKCVREVEETKPEFIEKPEQLAEASITPILKPEQFPCLSYYIARLLDPKSLEPAFTLSSSSEKCYCCENESCACFAHPNSIDTVTSEQKDVSQSNSSESCTENLMESNWKYEEHWTYNCLTMHMLRLREIYNDYAKLFAKSAPKCNLAMSRLCLWQLWRDCGIHKKELSLIEIDSYIAKNDVTLVKNLHYPFEKIEIWQFLHALLEASWHLYAKCNDVETEEMNGNLAGGLHKFLKHDIYPHAGNHIGSLCNENQDLLPMYCVFELYQECGYPPSATDLLRSTCALKSTTDPQPFSTTVDNITNFPDGMNSVTIGEKVSYLLKLDEIFASPHCTIQTPRKSENDLCNELLVFKELGASKMIEIMALICPGIRDANSGIIINMDYKLTFLEFYEIILEATKQLLLSKKKTEKELESKKIEMETASLKDNNLQETRTSLISEHRKTRKNLKTKNRTLI